MRVFNVNKAIGYASSGVEYAQKYRQEIFATWTIDDYYIFTDYISTNISVFTDLMGFPRKKIIWIYNYLARRPIGNSNFTVEQYLNSMADDFNISQKNEKFIDVVLIDKKIMHKIWLLKDGMIDRIDTIVDNKLHSVAHYDSDLSNVEYYCDGKIIYREFFSTKQVSVFKQSYKDNRILQTFIDGKVLNGRTEFFQYFFKLLNVKNDEVIIIDRALDVADSILPIFAGKARLFSVVHAEHFDRYLSEDNYILWNNHYEYIFEYAQYFEAIIAATEKQKNILNKQLLGKTKVVDIPVGYVKEIVENIDYAPFSLITASRLASEKNLDVLINAVYLARKKIPDLTLDIYGEGNRFPLNELIEEKNAGEYISLKGHHDLSKVYSRYGIYLSASTSEGFGLTLLEAISEGVPVIALNVPYGNQEFVIDGENGFLCLHTTLDEDVDRIAHSIVKYYQTDMEVSARNKSKVIAKDYLFEEVEKKWRDLLENNI